MRMTLIIMIALLGLPVLCLLGVMHSTNWRVEAFKTHVVPGMSVEELQRFAGKPSKIIHRDEPLAAATRSHQLLSRDDHTAVYLYSKEGLPYFFVYVFTDDRKNVVTRSVVEAGW